MKPFSILHISDLHRSPNDPISNDELISALVSDRDRYIREDPQISAPNAIVVSGDIIQGVPLGTKNFSKEIVDQYAVAEEFLDELVCRFLDGDRSRLIMVPGNHDIDWNTARSALLPVKKEDFPAQLNAALHSETSDFRWDWSTQTLYRIEDPDLYERRLEPFWQFFGKFYAGADGLLDVKAGADASLFSLCDDRIGLAAYNSCHGNDCFAFHGMIRRESIARSHLDLEDIGEVYDLRIAVWHHSIDGPPYHTDYMDIDIVRGMIGRGFRLGLYGHQHKTQVTPREVWLPDRERMAVVSAGSLCAGAEELPTGVHRQYNVLEITEDFTRVRVHVREMIVANLFSRGHFSDFGGASFADLDWTPPRTIVGTLIDRQGQRFRRLIEQAEFAAKTGKHSDAMSILERLELRKGSYERQMYLDVAEDTKAWDAIIKATNPPETIGELQQRFNAFSQLGDLNGAVTALNLFAERLQLPKPALDELRSRAQVQKVLKK